MYKGLNELVACIQKAELDACKKKKKMINNNNNGRRDEIDNVRYLRIDVQVEDRMVELIRRVAEIAVQEEQKSSSVWLRGDEKSSTMGDTEAKHNNTRPNSVNGHNEKGDNAAVLWNHGVGNVVFEYFCEVNVVSLFINIATGFAFTDQERQDADEMDDDLQTQDSLDISRNDSIDTNDAVASSSIGNISFDSQGLPHSRVSFTPNRLATVRIAIQVLQSMSILIQNVTMSTSLYLILSNNKVNELINLPLDAYAAAEKYQEKMNASSINDHHEDTSPHGHGSLSHLGEYSELTSIFISFLKSLTMKMNSETLQFYLTYPSSLSASNEHSDFNQIQFPLYERALEFCNPDVDSFVRVTAMNLCLNTLRLATDGEPLPPNNDEDDSDDDCVQTSGHDDTALHHDRPDRHRNPGTTSKLPFRERLAISHYVCHPSRVQNLSAGIFTRLASLCGKVEETIRTLDRIDRALSSCFMTVDECARESCMDGVTQSDGIQSKGEGTTKRSLKRTRGRSSKENRIIAIRTDKGCKTFSW
jgi:Uncharacterised conserved protein.